VNARRRKNHIHRLKHNLGWVTDHVAKEKVVHHHFQEAMKRGAARTHDFNWEDINYELMDLHHLGDPFSEEEVKLAINHLPSDKNPSLTVEYVT
jgi:hypothetical protein